MKRIFLLLFFLISFIGFSQTKKIKIHKADINFTDEEKYPGATVLVGNVKIEHEGAILYCKEAFYYKKRNFFKAIGDVIINQGDTIIQTSNYSDYDGNLKRAKSWGNVILKDPKMTLTTDTLNFDRVTQKLFYKHHAIIKDETNTLNSKIGHYYLNEKKFTATTKVVVTNPEHELTSNHLDYYTNSAFAYLYGSSTIKGKDNTIYTERGFYNTKAEISHFIKNSKIFFSDRTIEGDSLYYDKFNGFASATNNVKLIDTIQDFVAKGNYAEYFEQKDSVFIIDKAVAISKIEKDSIYIHGDTLLVTGKKENRVFRIFNKVKIFKSDLQGICDSIHSNQTTGLTRMFKNPVLWSDKNQIIGDSIHLVTNTKTEKLDSLKVLSNALIIQLDTIINGVSTFNQIKGRNMYGKFKDGKLHHFLVKGNAEVVFFNRNEKGDIETITKQECSSIEITFDENSNIEFVKYIKKPDGKSYPPEDLPIDKQKLKGFIWRNDERPKVMEDIFISEDKIPVTKKKISKNKILKKFDKPKQ